MDFVIADCDSLWGRLLATNVELILNSDELPTSLSLVMLTLSRSEWYVSPFLRRSSLASSVVSVMKAKSRSMSALLRDSISTSRPS